MLIGDSIQLRLVREHDLDTLFELTTDLEARGAYFPLGLQSETALRSEFAQTGFWEREKGMLLMARGEEVWNRVSNDLMNKPQFIRALQGALKGKEFVDQAVKK